LPDRREPRGTYTYSVWARDASSPGTTSTPLGRWDAYAALQYALTTTCTAVTASSSLSGIAAAGTAVTITGAATGCPNSQYEFFALYPGSHTWLVAQYYSCSATYSSNTAGEPKEPIPTRSGVRDASSSGRTSTALGAWDACGMVQVKPELSAIVRIIFNLVDAYARKSKGT